MPSPLPTNRPFFPHFLAAFRAQSAYQTSKASAGNTTSDSTAASTPSNYSTHAVNTPKSPSEPVPAANPHHLKSPANPNPVHGTTTVAVQAATSGTAFQPRRDTTSPLSRSPASQAYAYPLGSPLGSSRQRRGSDSSNEGFKDATGNEKWYIGGRTAGGDERFYKLSMVKRPRSLDRVSLDRMSL